MYHQKEASRAELLPLTDPIVSLINSTAHDAVSSLMMMAEAQRSAGQVRLRALMTRVSNDKSTPNRFCLIYVFVMPGRCRPSPRAKPRVIEWAVPLAMLMGLARPHHLFFFFAPRPFFPLLGPDRQRVALPASRAWMALAMSPDEPLPQLFRLPTLQLPASCLLLQRAIGGSVVPSKPIPSSSRKANAGVTTIESTSYHCILHYPTLFCVSASGESPGRSACRR
jgi:hypothetical protein